MSKHEILTPRKPDEKLGTIIKLAALAVGGQGGGVLTGWIEAVARSQGYVCQATSVAGVAQRTGATIYYLEMAPKGPKPPIFSLAPAEGDVDILIAAEMMEAGRAIMRGFVTPDRTTLVASTHRMLAVSEKMVPGDGIADAEEVRAAAEVAADQLVMFDMQKTAVENGSVISSSLFGALAGSGALPFPREAFEDAIRASGKGVDASLRAFGAAYAQARGETEAKPAAAPAKTAPALSGPERLTREWAELQRRVDALPAEAHALARAGLIKVARFMDLTYARDYVGRLEQIARDDADESHDFTAQAAKYLANAMAYDDVIRVADLKTRGRRFERISAEMGVKNQALHVTEFMHPRAEEIVGMLPAGLGARAEASPRTMRLLDRLFNKGRRVRTDGLIGFTTLYFLGGLKSYRRRTLRHKQEMAHLEAWLSRALAAREQDYAYGVELLKNRRLVKGYSDTHARGLSKFDRVMTGAALLAGREDAADWTRRLREAALQDAKGDALEGALKTVESFV